MSKFHFMSKQFMEAVTNKILKVTSSVNTSKKATCIHVETDTDEVRY